MTTYQPGSFGVVDVKGPGGVLIGIAQALVNDASRYKHAFVILDAQGTILEAEPHGARIRNISEYAGAGLLISDAPVREHVAQLPSTTLDTEKQIRADVVTVAEALVGTPYSFADYLAIAALKLHLPSKALRSYVASSGHMICSQLVDAVYLRAGIHLFTDGRRPGDVMPADLAAWIEDHEQVRV